MSATVDEQGQVTPQGAERGFAVLASRHFLERFRHRPGFLGGVFFDRPSTDFPLDLARLPDQVGTLVVEIARPCLKHLGEHAEVLEGRTLCFVGRHGERVPPEWLTESYTSAVMAYGLRIDANGVLTDVLPPELGSGLLDWKRGDLIYRTLRRRLQANHQWRMGPLHAARTASEILGRLSGHGDLRGRRFLDLGCGEQNPYGLQALMYLNGARSCTGLDLTEGDSRTQAECLWDLLARCRVYPDKWNLTGQDPGEFSRRLQRFDMEALEEGLLGQGLDGAPLRYLVQDIREADIAPASVDLMVSFVVLEHLMPFAECAARLAQITAPGGLAFHRVDFKDHRFYADPDRYSPWSCLLEGEEGGCTIINGLRRGEMQHALERAGFEVLSEARRTLPVPREVTAGLAPRYRDLPVEEIETVGVDWVLRRR